MMAFLNGLWGAIRGAVGLVLPLFDSGLAKRLGPTLWRILHVVMVIAIVLALWWANVYFHVDQRLPKVHPPWLADLWLPILFLLGYVICWLSWWLWKLLLSEEEVSNFPDLDEAWAAAVARLDRAGYDLAEFPLFVILGQLAEQEEYLFAAAGLSLKVKEPRSSTPVHVYATSDAIYVTCPNCSVLSREASWLAGKVVGGGEGEEGTEPMDDMQKPDLATLVPTQGEAPAVEMQDLLISAEREGRSLTALTPVERRELRRLSRASTAGRATRMTAETLDLQSARLGHLCRLIARDRRPRCGLNGILVLIPFASTDTTQDAADVADSIQRDLEVTRSAFGVHCPVLALLCDMESAPGFGRFVEQFTVEQRARRMGQRCPLFPGLPTRDAAGIAVRAMLRGVATFLCTGFLKRWVYEKCKLEKPGGLTLKQATETNSQLFMLLDEMALRQENLARILEDGFSRHAPQDRLIFGGCYLAATGSAEQPVYRAFVAGVLDRLREGESCVYWTDEVKQEEARIQRWINWVWVMLFAATGGLIMFITLWFTVFR